MNKHIAIAFIVFFCMNMYISVHSMEDCACAGMQKETLPSKFSKKSLYGHIAARSLCDALAYIRELQPVNQIDSAVLKAVRINLEHFHQLYNRYMFIQNISQLSLSDEKKRTDSSSFSSDEGMLECAIKMQQDGFPMARILIHSTGLSYMVNMYRNRQGQSLLHCAVSANNEQLIRWLFTCIDECRLVIQDDVINAVNVHGQTPLDVAMAAIDENEAIISLLIEKGATYTAPKAPSIRLKELVFDEAAHAFLELEQCA